MESTERFTERVGDYRKYRPSYPDEIIALMQREVGLHDEMVIADIGSGTGLSALPFLRNGNVVYGVEPNRAMREVQELLMEQFPRFRSIDGRAESTTLADESVDMVLCAQSFHWFANEACKQEFSRILKPSGNLVLVWNARNTKSELQVEYERILTTYIEEYSSVNHKNIQNLQIEEFFHPKVLRLATLEHGQKMDLEGLKGRLKSTSYCPKEGEQLALLLAEMESLFAKYEHGGQIEFAYETLIYWC